VTLDFTPFDIAMSVAGAVAGSIRPGCCTCGTSSRESLLPAACARLNGRAKNLDRRLSYLGEVIVRPPRDVLLRRGRMRNTTKAVLPATAAGNQIGRDDGLGCTACSIAESGSKVPTRDAWAGVTVRPIV
jgi:hypothetical protein